MCSHLKIMILRASPPAYSDRLPIPKNCYFTKWEQKNLSTSLPRVKWMHKKQINSWRWEKVSSPPRQECLFFTRSECRSSLACLHSQSLFAVFDSYNHFKFQRPLETINKLEGETKSVKIKSTTAGPPLHSPLCTNNNKEHKIQQTSVYITKCKLQHSCIYYL